MSYFAGGYTANVLMPWQSATFRARWLVTAALALRTSLLVATIATLASLATAASEARALATRSLATLSASGDSSKQQRALTVSLIAPRGAERTREDWAPMLDDLSRALKRPVELRVGNTQREVIADLLEQRADIAWLGNAPALEVVEAGAAAVFAAMVRLDGGTGYRSVIVTHKDSGIANLTDLLDPARKLTFASGDPKSTSGYVVPNYYVFARNKVQPERLFAKIVVGNHAENALRVARKEVDAGVCNDSELLAFKSRYPEELAKLKVIWQSVEIPESPMVWRVGLDDATKVAVRKFFTRYGATPIEQAKLVAINNLKRFRASSNRQLLLIADIEMFNARTQIDRDLALTLGERGIKHQEIVKRAVRLETALRMQ
jgi:phosphonate transport system substrate-binding protein